MDDSTGPISRVRSLGNGKGVQYLIDRAYKILGNPLVLFNMEYELMFHVKNVVTDDQFWNEIVEEGVFSDASIRFFLDECFIDDVANSKKITFLTSDTLKYERLYGRVFNSYNNTVADVVMVACNKPFRAQDTAVFEAVCDKLSQELSMDEFFKAYGILYHQKLICKLLDDDIDDKVIYSGHLSNLYEDLKTNLYVVTADMGKCKSNRSNLEGIRDLFKELQPEHKYAVYSNYIVIIASNNEATPDIEKNLHKLSGHFNNNVRIGVSSCFENLFNLRRYYDEAVDSLNFYKRLFPNK